MGRAVRLVLILGAVAGFGSEACRHGTCHREHARSFERHVAEVCVDAARSQR